LGVESIVMTDLQALTKEELLALLTQAMTTLQAQQARIHALEQEIARLKSGSAPPPSSPQKPTPPAFVKPNAPKRPSKGRKKRAHSFVRKRQQPTHTIPHFPQTCSGCGRKLAGGWLHRVREVLELPQVPVQVIHHQIMARHCGVCHKRQVAQVDLSESVVGQSRLGVRLTSLIAYLDSICRMPVRLLRKLLGALYGLWLSVGEISEVLHRVAARAQPTYQGLLQQLRTSRVVHADETSWRENGKNGYAWSFSTPTLHYFQCQKNRSGSVVKETLGTAFRGALVSDFYNAYHYYPGPHQYCWVHLLRDVKELSEQYPNDAGVTEFATALRTLYDEAKTYSSPNLLARRSQCQDLRVRLCALAHRHEAQERPERVLAQRLLRHELGLFVFVEWPEVPSSNNAAERSVRPLVVMRKVSGGTRSAQGSQTVAVLMSLFCTWQAQGKDLLQACQQMLTTPLVPETG
jgi:transposase